MTSSDKQTAPGPRETAALQALERARVEDAKDASLPPCRICGGKAVRHGWIGGKSTGGGFVTVQCERGDQEQRINLDRGAPPYLTYEQAEYEAMKRWRALNEKPKAAPAAPTSAETMIRFRCVECDGGDATIHVTVDPVPGKKGVLMSASATCKRCGEQVDMSRGIPHFGPGRNG